jgi:hypothetical protein
MDEGWRVTTPGYEYLNNINTSPEPAKVTEDEGWKVTTPGYEYLNTPSGMPPLVQPRETFSEALKQAPGRIGTDFSHMIANTLRSIPSYYQKAKTEIPGYAGTIIQHPGHFLSQGIAGAMEAINSLAQTPKQLASYGEKILHLLPVGTEAGVSAISPEDTSQVIKEIFGEPKYPGEAMERGIARNLPTVLGVSELVKKLLNLIRPSKTSKEFAEQGISNIQKEYALARKNQNIEFNKFFDKYGDKAVTKKPVSYLGLREDEVRHLTPTAKKLYDKFVDKPQAQYLHDLQSQLGKDAVKATDQYSRNLYRDAQMMFQGRLENFAQSLNDPYAYNGLLEGRRITRDVVKPFESTKEMKKIAKKNINPGERTFNQLKSAVQKSTESGENILDPITNEIKGRIGGVPDSHYIRFLKEQLNKQQNIIDARKRRRNIALTAGGAIGLEELIRNQYLKNIIPPIE